MPVDDEAIPYVQIAQQQNFSRTDQAATKRAFQDLKARVGKLQNELVGLMASDAQCGQQQFQDAWNKRQELNQFNRDLETMEKKMTDIMPPPSNNHLNEEERRQIRGLYASGLYTQTQLANQYGVTQPTISDVTKAKD